MSNPIDLMQGVRQYETAAMYAFWEEVIGRLRGKPAQLLSFDEVRECLRLWKELDRGLHDIPMEQIVGSVGRPNDFTGSFRPKNAVSRERWTRIFAETIGEMGLPPIEVYKVGDVYYVRDGNHRVSVARSMGFDTIQAYVTEVTGIEAASND